MEYDVGREVKDDRYGNGVITAVTNIEVKAYYSHPIVICPDGKRHKTSPMNVVYQTNKPDSIKHLSVR